MKSDLRTYLIAGLAVALADATDGVIFFYLTAGLNPIAVLQYIASGVVGAAAFSGGLATAVLGLGAHFFLSYAFTAVLFAVLRLCAPLRRTWAITGIAWGAAVYLFMALVALPHSNVAHTPLTALTFIHGIVGHALFVGLLPAFLIARWRGARTR